MTDSGTIGPNGARTPGERPRRPAAGRWCSLLLGLLLIAPIAARAAEPVLTVLKNTLLGGVTGLVLGGALSLVADDDHRADVVRWGFVIGTFGGFAVGITLAARGEEGLFHAEDGWAVADPARAMPSRRIGRAAPPSFSPARPVGPGRPDAFGLLSTSLTLLPNGR